VALLAKMGEKSKPCPVRFSPLLTPSRVLGLPTGNNKNLQLEGGATSSKPRNRDISGFYSEKKGPFETVKSRPKQGNKLLNREKHWESESARGYPIGGYWRT
jgi:hypothetical protein